MVSFISLFLGSFAISFTLAWYNLYSGVVLFDLSIYSLFILSGLYTNKSVGLLFLVVIVNRLDNGSG